MELEARYVEIEKRLRTQGYPEHMIKEVLVTNRVLDEKLNRLECPTCGGELSHKLDPRQSGAHPMPGGKWHNYRCTCGFMIDRVE